MSVVLKIREVDGTRILKYNSLPKWRSNEGWGVLSALITSYKWLLRGVSVTSSLSVLTLTCHRRIVVTKRAVIRRTVARYAHTYTPGTPWPPFCLSGSNLEMLSDMISFHS